MKRLLLPLLLASACGGSSTGDEPDAAVAADADTSPARVDVTWHIVSNEAPADCPAGATTATIYAQRLGDAEPFADIYDCSAGAGSATDLPAGDYTIWIELTDDGGATLYAESESATLNLSPGETPAADFVIDGTHGAFDVSWQLHTAGGAATTCAAVTNDGVSILQTNNTTTEGTDDLWDCTAGEAPSVVTDEWLPIGDYTIAVSLLDATQASIGDAPTQLATIEYGNQFVDLGVETITLF
jgi:hypothetical protein